MGAVVPRDGAHPRWWSSGWVVLGGAVAAAGWAQVFASAGWSAAPTSWLPGLVVAVLVGASVAASQRAPGVALALVWLAGVVQVLEGLDALLAQLSVVVVAFGAARRGSSAVVWISGASIPTGCLAVAGYALVRTAAFTNPAGDLSNRLAAGGVESGQVLLVAGLALLALLSLPWLTGLVARYSASARLSRRGLEDAREQRSAAQDVAALRAAQTHLAREVHDVVGHSLAVILAQAESARFLRDDEISAMRTTMATVALSARQSLREVRAVLTSTAEVGRAGPAVIGQDEGVGTGTGDLDALVAGVAAAHEVRDVVRGTPAVLSAPVDVAAYRALQEMLTNALKHGRRGAPIEVERTWGQDLVLTVINVAEVGGGASSAGGRGLAGMRERLASVGGQVTLSREHRSGGRSGDSERAGATVVTTRASIPLSRDQG